MDAAQTLIREAWFTKPRPRGKSRAGFTRTALLIVIAIVAILVALAMSSVSRARAMAFRMSCIYHEEQVALALQMYAGDNKDRLPDNQRPGGGISWPWDLPWNAGTNLETNGTKWQIWYCPGTWSAFSYRDNSQLWNFSPGSYHVLGYAMTFTNTSTLASTNCNSSMPTKPNLVAHPTSPTDVVLLADLTISQPGQNNEANRAANTYANIQGGYSKPFRTSHMGGALPAGGNVCMLDGHVEWRRFEKMQVRTVGSASPVFWW
jgi:prepilin-type processing-associated H-X9-DG protein